MRVLFYLSLFLTFTGYSQDNWPEAYPVSPDSLHYARFSEKYWQYVLTGQDSVPFDKALSPAFEKRFETFKGKQFNGLNHKENIWVRFRLKNPSDQDVAITIRVLTEEGHIYIRENSRWKHLRTGYLVPWKDRDGLKRFYEVIYTLPPKSERPVYMYLKEAQYADAMIPRINNYLTVVEGFHNEPVFTFGDTVSAAFFGFILFAVAFNLLFYYVNREKVYLVYSLTLLVAALYSAVDVIDLAYFRDNPKAGNMFQAVVVLVLIVMVLHTMRYFFRIRHHYPRWDKVLVWTPPVLLVMSGLSLLLRGELGQWAVNVAAIATLVTIIVFIVGTIIMVIAFLRKKNKDARLFVIAALPFLISLLISMFSDYEWIVLVTSTWTILVLSWGMFARFKSLQIENARVALEKEEERNRLIAEQNELLEKQVAERTAELQQSISELKQTQNQLIQSEKMASLGELTAGIAHEIQNPLNFVNNFSDVSRELLDEMEEELDNGDTDEAKAIAGDIKQNLEKIAHHGRRADSIVKGMLQHSRASSGQKEPTDINALADEYLRLAYHGLRAKDKSFNADLVTNFEEGLQKPAIIPQDVGRVLLNLFTNAFYATQQKSSQSQSSYESYKPKVTITTKQVGNSVEISVTDNGTGIQDTIKDKILQPFFTTKPTGEGTGLGLSLSYDIIVKGHGGSIDIKSTEGEGATFIIILPV